MLERMSFNEVDCTRGNDLLELTPFFNDYGKLAKEYGRDSISYGEALIGYGRPLSLTKLFDNYSRLVNHYNTSDIPVSRHDILLVAGLSAIQELTNIKIHNDNYLADMLEMESRNGDSQLIKLELTCDSDLSSSKVEMMAKFMGRLNLEYLELSIGNDCNAIPILQQINYSSLVTFKLRGMIDEAAWEALDDGFRNCSMMEDLTLLSRTSAYKDALPRIVSGLSLKSLHTLNCTGTSDEEWANMLQSMDVSQLTYINIAYSQFGSKAAKTLIDRLSEAKALSRLILIGTAICETAYKNLNDAIKKSERNIYGYI
ncbi:hypothetical protein K7432_007502 [Basidiobolus ranarum]|uniref:Uncharacterized protein n=1 Tax=Basidiobolus ranarum TaxID=34480 RepID=A0ABR2W007_9FUNG